MDTEYGNNNRNFVFDESDSIILDDYFLVNDRDFKGVSRILRYDDIDFVNNKVYFEDLLGGTYIASFDPDTEEGVLTLDQGTYTFFISSDTLIMDLNNDGHPGSGEAIFNLPDGSYIDFGPEFLISIVTPERLLTEKNGDETTQFSVLFDTTVDLDITSPQGTVFQLFSYPGGIRKGVTLYGIEFELKRKSDADELTIALPGEPAQQYYDTNYGYYDSTSSSATAKVYVSLEPGTFQELQNQLVQPLCGNKVLDPGEGCDPPGSLCAENEQAGICAYDCTYCEVQGIVCGNFLLEEGEQCETNGDCSLDEKCNSCVCVPLPEAICGNDLIDVGEECERTIDCPDEYVCRECSCISYLAEVQVPAPQGVVQIVERRRSIAERFFSWFLDLL
ncbi:hypothetical protein COV18_07360 [Candidatus Woesearchaeota archaeon CG10_big_fil_rev_8_21_14_0_10_37_12]|nr:MAG: hypothetical protein COV18_07360 [Candidatus Woesearchaeota archaeon CG10_big_fil_rev_8_21_14_0_10_37_12]